MRYLGIDYGSKRVGVSLSDESGVLAMPLVVLKNSTELIIQISKICKEKEVGVIVVGESKDYDFKDNKIMVDIRDFAEKVEGEVGIPVHFHPEFLTSKQAEHLQGKNDMLDASAATIILQSYLDSKK